MYPIFVCCDFENSPGSKIWPETISCDSSMTPGSCCAARAKGWGWLPAWRVLHAQYGECGNACKFYLMQSEVPVETAGGECQQCCSTCLGGHWDLVSSCDGMVWSGMVGPVGRYWTMDPHLPINRDVLYYKTCGKTNNWSGLKWGRSGVKGKSCASASYSDILDCIRSKPGFSPPWSWLNNCQTDVQQAISGCCLECLDLERPRN